MGGERSAEIAERSLLVIWHDEAFKRPTRRRRFWRGLRRHSHTYERVGYGGAGWSLYRCSTCGDTEIDA